MAGCLTFIPISCMGPKHATKGHGFEFSTYLYALEHVHVVLNYAHECIENSVNA